MTSRAPAAAPARRVAQPVERASRDRERRRLAVADLDALAESTTELARSARVGQVFLRPEDQRRLVLGNLHGHDADAARKRRRVETVLAGPRSGAAEPDVQHVERPR